MRAQRNSRNDTRLARAAGLAVAIGLIGAAPAGAVQVTCGSGSGLAGETVEITLSTGDLTGLGIHSFQFDLAYNSSVATAVGTSVAGTTAGSAGWGNATINPVAGKVSVVDVGVSPLSGSGPLIKVQFLINPSLLGGGGTGLGLPSASFVFNEGAPVATTVAGFLSVNPTPIISVSPNTGEVIRAQNLQFFAGGSVTNPVTWSTSNPSVATISGTGLLTGVAPGTVRVFVVDNAGRRDTTDGDIVIRGMGLTAGSASVPLGQTFDVPLTVTSLTGLGIRSGQVTLICNPAVATPIGVETPPGTLLNGYGSIAFGSGSGSCTVDFVGSGDLAGAGTLCSVRFQASSSVTGGFGFTPTVALFGETLYAKTTGGSVSVTGLPSIFVTPDQVALFAGQTQSFSAGGSPSPPVVWSTLNPAVATIDASGLLTAVSGGVTKVHAVDALGAVDENTSVTVYDFKASLPVVQASPGGGVRVPLLTDRDISGLDIRSLEYTVGYNGTWVTSAEAFPLGLVSTWGAGGLQQHAGVTSLRVAAGGTNPLGGGTGEIQVLYFMISPSAPVGIDIPLTLSGLVFNEGHPFPLVANGVIQVRATSDVPDSREMEFALGACQPNPVHSGGHFPFAIPSSAAPGARTRLVLYGIDGRSVRTLVDEPVAPGRHIAVWDGTDEAGQPVTAGVYFYRLTCGGLSLSRKLALTR
jgi:hypothetical protein